MIEQLLHCWHKEVKNLDPLVVQGKIKDVVGFTCRAAGIKAPIGTICSVENGQKKILMEVTGFQDNDALLMPLSEMEGVARGQPVLVEKKQFQVPVGEGLIGRVLNAFGEPIDGKGPLNVMEKVSIQKSSPPPLSRRPIREMLPLGIKVIDACVPVGKGQRMGIFSGSGVGKSLLLGQIARYASSEVNVIALVGERGREVREFIEKSLGEQGLRRSVVVVATSDEPALRRLKAGFLATRVAEYFRDQGKDVLFMMDSITRLAFAQREVGLSSGEPPATKGYPPSVYAMLPRLLERTGASDKGSITGLYTVLVEADDLGDPVADQTLSILDGHIVLSRKLASRNQYPAVDILQSNSRAMIHISSARHLELAEKIRQVFALQQEVEDLLLVGAYKEGVNKEVDRALNFFPKLESFFRQKLDEVSPFEKTLAELQKILQ